MADRKARFSIEHALLSGYLSTRTKEEQQKMRLGIISALHEEQAGLVEAMERPSRLIHGMREYFVGQLWEIDAVCVLSRIGKVAAAMTATTLVEKFGVTHILFTGVAGAGDKTVRVGDIVIAESLVQHDMDASPLFPRFEVPLIGRSHFQPDLQLSMRLSVADAQAIMERRPGRGGSSRHSARGARHASSGHHDEQPHLL